MWTLASGKLGSVPWAHTLASLGRSRIDFNRVKTVAHIS